jgi:hypothetical protein
MSAIALRTAKTFLRDNAQPPRASQFMAAHPGNLDPELLQRFIDDVWAGIPGRLADPIRVTETAAERVVEVLGVVRYHVCKATGQIEVRTLDRTLVFAPSNLRIAVDPPMRPTSAWIDGVIYHWWDRMAEVLIEHRQTDGENWLATAQRVFWRAMYRSVHWKRLRYAARAALGLDPKILAWSRHGQSRHLNQAVTNHQYNTAVSNRTAYAEVERDNPNLLWLLTILLDELEGSPGENVVATMRDMLAQAGVTPAGWRLLANGSEKDFRHLRDWLAPDGGLDGRAKEIPPWLRFMVALRRKTPLPGAIQQFFLHDYFDKNKEGQVRFRNVWMDVPVVRIVLAEAERRLARGTLQSFIGEDLVEVVTWLEAEQPSFDKNQLKAGWKHLETRAVQWKVEVEAAEAFGHLKWSSALATTTIGAWTVVPLTDAWALRHEALRQHHCADQYLSECLAGEYRLFSVRSATGRPVATLGIELRCNGWQSFGFRGACNKPVGQSLHGLDNEIAGRYTDLWRLTQPIPPAVPETVEREDPAHYSSEEDSRCPICGSDGSDCETHTVACYDMFQATLLGGALDRPFNGIEGEVKGILTQAVASGLRDVGLGCGFNALLDDLRQDVASGAEISEALRNWGPTLRSCLMDLLLEQPEVQCTTYDFDGNMPGTSTAYKTYWAEDPYAAVTRLESRLEAVAEWLAAQTTDAETLIALEDRLGVTVDRDDPMLPAVIAMEQALRKMCGRK